MYLYHLVSITYCFLKSISLKKVPPVETIGRVYFPRTGEEIRGLWLPRLCSGVNQGHILLISSSNKLLEWTQREASESWHSLGAPGARVTRKASWWR